MIKNNYSSPPDLVLVEDNKEFAQVLGFLYRKNGKNVNIYHTPDAFLEKLDFYPKHTKICTDYDLSCSITGIDLAEILHQKGYCNLI